MEKNSQGCMQPHEMMIEKMWDDLSDEQKRMIASRIIDSKIIMKENTINI